MNGLKIIAECGSSPNGCLDVAFNAAEIAIRAGADYVKFRVCSSKPRGHRLQPLDIKQFVSLLNIYPNHVIPTLHSWKDIKRLNHFLSYNSEYYPKIIKIPPPIDVVLLEKLTAYRAAERHELKIIQSLGLLEPHEIKEHLLTLEDYGVISCITGSNYPCLVDQSNVSFVGTTSSMAYSDHCGACDPYGIVPFLAITFGAKYLEIHFQLGATGGRDDAVALNAPTLMSYIERARQFHKCLNFLDKTRQPSRASEELRKILAP